MSATEENPEGSRDPRERYYRERARTHVQAHPHGHAPSNEVVFNLVFTYDVVVTELTRVLAPFDISLSALNVLLILKRAGESGCMGRELSELLVVSKASVTGLLDALERRELVERVPATTDRRCRITRVSEKGLALVDEVLPVYYPAVREICKPLPAAAKKQVCELLETLRDGARAAARHRDDQEASS
jgi:MarR family 2-MHQ and catechol resistance regulon transcriptional repressor